MTFWIATELPGNSVLMGAYAAPNISPSVAALMIYTIKYFILILTMNCFSAAVTLVVQHYKVPGANCFHLTGKIKKKCEINGMDTLSYLF